MGVAVTASREVRVEQPFQESERPSEPGDLHEVGELPPREYGHDDPFTVSGGKVTGEAPVYIAADPAPMPPAQLGLGQHAQMTGDGVGHVLQRQLDRAALPGMLPAPV